MRAQASQSWRRIGDSSAFDHGAWEFKARQFYVVGKRLIEQLAEQMPKPDFEAIMGLASGEYLLCLALELMIKAHYLKAKAGPREEIYDHEVSDLLAAGLLNDAQRVLLKHAERYVIWAGRYPTPKWTKEHYKEDYDVDSKFVDGSEVIDGSAMPNSASLPRAKELIALFEHLWQSWRQLPDA